jgi:hypothetical protein
VTGARLLVTTSGAPWLPPGGDAEVWVGDDVPLPEPTIIVRLLLARRPDGGPARFFCVPGAKGLDLPTRHLEPGPERADPSLGVARLVAEVLGAASDTSTRCIGFVRNVVRVPDATCPHPVPWAHVPVLAVSGDPAAPVVAGEWVDVASARAGLGARHWWPIVEHHFCGDRVPDDPR